MNKLDPNSSSVPKTMDLDFEKELLANRLVSEVRRTPDHISLTLTGDGFLAFVKAMNNIASDEEVSFKDNSISKKKLFPEKNEEMVPKKDVVEGFRVTHTTLWKWEKKGYLTPVRVGKKVYYKRADLERLTK